MGTYWLSNFLLGIRGYEVPFEVNPKAITIEESNISVLHRNLSGDLLKSIIKPSVPTIRISGDYLSSDQRERLNSLCRSPAFLSFIPMDAITSYGNFRINNNNKYIDFYASGNSYSAPMITSLYYIGISSVTDNAGSLCYEFARAMNAAFTSVFTATYNPTTQLFTVTRSGGNTYQFLWHTGSDYGYNAASLLGFNDADTSLASTHTSNNQVIPNSNFSGFRVYYDYCQTYGDNSHLMLNNSSALQLAKAYAFLGTNIINIEGVYSTPDNTTANYFTGGSFNASTGVITLGTPVSGASYVQYQYRGWLVTMDKTTTSHNAGWVDRWSYDFVLTGV
jgi:hypothetical protein